MKLQCPNNPEHKRFSVSVRVLEDWVVDADGNFLSCRGTVDADPPGEGDDYWCIACRDGTFATKLPDPPQPEPGTLGGLPTTNYTGD